jgi:hypothetical protein
VRDLAEDGFRAVEVALDYGHVWFFGQRDGGFGRLVARDGVDLEGLRGCREESFDEAAALLSCCAAHNDAPDFVGHGWCSADGNGIGYKVFGRLQLLAQW